MRGFTRNLPKQLERKAATASTAILPNLSSSTSSSPLSLTPNVTTVFKRAQSTSIKRDKVQTSAEVANARAKRQFVAELEKSTNVKEMMNAFEKHHPYLFLPDLLILLKKLTEVKLNNMQSLRHKLAPADVNPARDERMNLLLDGVQVRVLNRQYVFTDLAQNAELCRALAIFRYDLGVCNSYS